MGLFSFGNKDAAPARRSRSSAGAERQGAARASRAPGGERRSGQASLLDPTLPEKQRARRRLVGAIALVMAAVVVLPMVLDSHPKPASDDIAVNIPRVAKPLPTPPQRTDMAPALADVSPSDNPANLASDSAVPATQAPPKTLARVAPAAGQAADERGASAQTTPAVARNVASTPATSLPSTAPSTANSAGHTPASSASGSRFVVSVGSFASDSSAHAWLAKLKALGVPAYLEGKRLLLRAGPFGDRASAEAAVKKVRDAGLSAQSSAQSATQGPVSGAVQ